MSFVEEFRQMDRQGWLELGQTLSILLGLVALGTGLGLLWAMNLVNGRFALLSPAARGVGEAREIVNILSGWTTAAFAVFVVGLLAGLAIEVLLSRGVD